MALYTTGNPWLLWEESGGVREVTTEQTNRTGFYLRWWWWWGGFSLKSVHQCSCSGLCVNIFPCTPHMWRLYELEHCWGNRRTVEVIDWGTACLYSSGEEQGAERLTMQRSSPSLTSLSSLYPFNPLPCLRRLHKNQFLVIISVQHLYNSLYKRPVGCKNNNPQVHRQNESLVET